LVIGKMSGDYLHGLAGEERLITRSSKKIICACDISRNNYGR